MEILPKDDEIINQSSELSTPGIPEKKPEVLESIEELIPSSKDTGITEQVEVVTKEKVVNKQNIPKSIQRPSRRTMVAAIKAHKTDIANRANFRKGTAVQLSTLYLKICNLNFTISNLKHLSDEEIFAIWKDIKLSK